ncbi:hypothetical protein SLE2022_120080 [Rubroshorea leprosula]
MVTKLESSSLEIGDEDHEMLNAKISGDEYGSIEEERLHKEGDTIANGRGVMTVEGFEKDGEGGLFNIGPALCCEDGLETNIGLANKLPHGGENNCRDKSKIGENLNAQIESEIRDSKGKRKKNIRECYQGDMAEC